MKSLVESKIILNNKEYIYVLERKRIKNIYFRVKEDAKIYVNANHMISTNKIEKLLQENSSSIEKLYEKATRKKDKLIYLGDQLTFCYKDSSPFIENNNIYGRTEEECQNYIYTQAYDIFNMRLTQLKHNFDSLPEFKLKVRKMTSKWGVCNLKSMTVTLNLELITKSVNLIDYVIIHELCHFKHMNHSKEYWSYVESFYPYYKKARKELNY